MSKKRVILASMALLFLVTLALTGCGGADAGDSGKGKLVKVSICVSNKTPATIAMNEVFKPYIEEKLGDKYDIQLYDSGILGAEKVTYDYTKSGIVEMCVVGTSMWSETPKMTIPDFPYLFDDVEHARACYEGELGNYIKEDIEGSKPVQLLGWMPNGARIFSSGKELKTVEDFKGQKMRMPNNPIHVKLAESLGSSVVIMDMGEVFTSLEQGVVDGQDNPASTFINEGWYEVQDYVYDTKHIITSLELFAGNEFWDELPAEDQKIFEEAAQKASAYAWDLYEEQLESDMQFLKDEGLTVTEPTPEDRKLMTEKMQPVYEYLEGEYDWVDEAREIVKKAK